MRFAVGLTTSAERVPLSRIGAREPAKDALDVRI